MDRELTQDLAHPTRIRLLENADGFSKERLYRLLDLVGSEVELVLTTESKSLKRHLDRAELPSNVTVMMMSEAEGASLSGYPEFPEHLSAILKDENTALFYDRPWDPLLGRVKRRLLGDTRSQLKYQAEVTKTLIKTWHLLTRVRPTFLLSVSTPHAMSTWIRACVAELLGVPVLIVQRCANPNYYRVAVGLRKHRKLLNLINIYDPDHAKNFEGRLAKYLEDVELGYDAAMPDYERVRLNRNRGKYLSYWHLVSSKWYQPTWIINTLRSWKALKKAAGQSRDRDAQKYAVYFLHYQPERTTLPEGFGFTQQLNAIYALRQSTPADVHLYVKEHPSTFTHQCVPACRSPGTYRDIASIDGVSFEPIESDVFKLIDDAVYTATVTGTVGFESMLRGVPCIFLGLPPCMPAVGCHAYNDYEELKRFIDAAVQGRFDKGQVSASMVAFMKSEVNGSFYSALGDNENKQEKRLNVLQLLLSGENLEVLISNKTRRPGSTPRQVWSQR